MKLNATSEMFPISWPRSPACTVLRPSSKLVATKDLP
jgi:hypothetical protein